MSFVYFPSQRLDVYKRQVGIQDEKFYGRAKKRKCINFGGKKNICFIISLILILVGPVSMMIHQKTDGSILNYSLEFSGGTATTVTFNEDMDIKQIDSEVTPVVEKVTGDKNVQPTKVCLLYTSRCV